jgi:hypothetical protein
MDPTLATIRAAALLYAASLASMLLRGGPARALWTAACVLYLAHVAAAFDLHHHWSHTEAYLETARQTRELFGVAYGGGLYWNYVLTAVWVADALWWWAAPQGRAARPRWVSAAIHGFLALMFFNGAVVFARGVTRWTGVALTAALAILALARRARRGRV